MRELSDLAIFAEVVSARNFSVAASRLEVSKATVSKHISHLERRLGTKLLNRTTRSVSLTEAGAALYIRCRQILAEADKAFAELACFMDSGKGTLRVTAPVTLGLQHVVPTMAHFLLQNPSVRGDVLLTNGAEDLSRERVDVAIRITRAPNPQYISRRLADCPMVTCASPCYLQRHGSPTKPADLAAHDCLVYDAPPRHDIWRFMRGSDDVEIRVEGRLVTNNGEAMRLAVLAGLGVAVMPLFFIEDDLSEGRLKRILADYEVPEFGIFALYPHHHQSTGHVLAFVNAVASRLKSGSADDPPPMILDRLFLRRRSSLVSTAA